MKNTFSYSHEFESIKFHFLKTENIAEREIHDYHELLFYIGGNATLSTETFKQKLENNSLIFIPSGKFHSLALERPEDFIRLKISFTHNALLKNLPQNILEKVSVISSVSHTSLTLLNKICSSIENKNEQNLFLLGAFLTVLSEFANENAVQSAHPNTSTLVSECINYVENNISSDLSVKTLSHSLNFSVSTITHTFKREMGISIHKYVTQKRLIYAKRLLESGKTPTEVYSLCGYGNYSSFYKAYVKYFNVSPKV